MLFGQVVVLTALEPNGVEVPRVVFADSEVAVVRISDSSLPCALLDSGGSLSHSIRMW